MTRLHGLNFQNARFITSCADPSRFPEFRTGNAFYPEIAVVGRSNAGKSSLINHLTQQTRLVKVSSSPGKTRLVNFFLLDEKLVLADLPGYGFANVDKTMRKGWGELLSQYLEHRSELSLLLIILDIRRDLSEEDRAMITWALSRNTDLLFIFSKTDKLRDCEVKRAEKALVQSLQDCGIPSPVPHILYSVKDGRCRIELQQILSKLQPEM